MVLIYKKVKYLTMDSKKVKALLTSVEMGSLTAAAGELGYTQSGLTHMMNSLEDELGINLLIRSKSGVHLSPVGDALRSQLSAFVDSADALEKSISQMRERSFSTLRLGAYSSVARHWVPLILTNYRGISPETDVAITMSSISDIYAAVKNDELDCAIVSYQEGMCQGLNWLPLRDDPMLAVLPEGYKLESDSFPVKAFENAEFLMPSFGFDMDILPIFSGVSKKDYPRIRYTNLDDPTIVSMVVHGLGVSILSELVMRSITERVTTAPLSPPAYRRLGIITSEGKQNDKNIRRFIHCVQSSIEQLYRGHK